MVGTSPLHPEIPPCGTSENSSDLHWHLDNCPMARLIHLAAESLKCSQCDLKHAWKCSKTQCKRQKMKHYVIAVPLLQW